MDNLNTMPAGRPLKFKTPEELQEKIDAYFADCDANDEPYVITGLAVALGCDRDTLLNYSKREDFFGTIKDAKMKIHNYAEKYLYTGKNQVGAIFNLKNNWGWKDKTEQDVTSGGQPISIPNQLVNKNDLNTSTGEDS